VISLILPWIPGTLSVRSFASRHLSQLHISEQISFQFLPERSKAGSIGDGCEEALAAVLTAEV
jgi:hypothetical protein